MTLSFATLLLRNWLMKLVSLLLALVVWFYVNEQETDSQVLEAKLDIRVPRGVLVTRVLDPDGNPIDRLQVKVTGPRGSTRELMGQELQCKLKVERIPGPEEELRQKFLLTRENFELPPGIEVEPTPAQLSLTLGVERTVSLKVRFPGDTDGVTGELPEGWEIETYRFEPTRVPVTGPGYALARAKAVHAAKVSFHPADRGPVVEKVAPLNLGNIEGEQCESPLSSVKVIYQIRQRVELAEKELPVKLCLLAPPLPEGRKLELQEDTARVTLRGRPEVLLAFEKRLAEAGHGEGLVAAANAFIDYQDVWTEMSGDKVRIALQLLFNPNLDHTGIEVIGIAPSAVWVMERKPEEEEEEQ